MYFMHFSLKSKYICHCSTLIVIILPSVTIMAMCDAFGRIPFWVVNAVSLAYLIASAVFVPPFVYLEEGI